MQPHVTPPLLPFPTVQRRAFREVLRAIAACEHPSLHRTLHADVLPDVLRAAIYRPWAECGSLKDLIYKARWPILRTPPCMRGVSFWGGVWGGTGANARQER